MLSAHVGHNPLDHGGFHFLFSVVHGAWILMGLAAIIGTRIIYFMQKSQKKYA